MKKTALVGLGPWGRNILKELIHLGSNVTVVLHSPSVEKETWLTREFPEVAYTHSLGEVIGDESILRVCIATPMQTHFEVARLFADTHKTVFLEKPITDDATTAQELLSLFKEAPAKLMVGHIFLYHDCFGRVKEELADAKINSVLITKTSRTSESIHTSKAHFLDAFIHETSVLLSLFGMPQKLRNEGETLIFGFEKFEARVSVESESGQKLRRFAFETDDGNVVWENETIYREHGTIFSSTVPALERELEIFLNGFEKKQQEIQANNTVAVECVTLLERVWLSR